MAKKAYALDEEMFERLRQQMIERDNESRSGRGGHRGRYPIGVGGSCPDRNEIHQLTVLGSPTGGTFDMDLTLNGVTETLTFNWDDTNSDVETAYLGHSEATTGDFSVTGGPLPNAPVFVEFTGNFAGKLMGVPTYDYSGLTGGSGRAVFVLRVQPGYPS